MASAVDRNGVINPKFEYDFDQSFFTKRVKNNAGKTLLCER